MSNRMRYILVGLLVTSMAITLFVLFAILTQPAQAPSAGEIIAGETEYRGTVIDPPRELADFTMPASTGAEMSLSDLNGKWTLLFFGYANCPDFCPLTLGEFNRVDTLLGDTAEDVQYLFISVDGERDTPAVLERYLQRFNPKFIGFSGDDVTLAQIQPDYGFFYERRTDTGSATAYLVDHSTRSYLIDPQGRLRMSFAYGTEPAIIADAIREQMAAYSA
jgi:protein SCO1/2